MKYVVLFAVLLLPASLMAQLSLQFYADAFTHLEDAENRMLAHEQFLRLFLEEADDADVSYAVNSPYINEIRPADSSWVLYNWQVRTEDNVLYHAYFRHVLSTELIAFTDAADELYSATRETLSPDEWVGAYYYNTHADTTADGQPYVILLGLNKHLPAYDLKIADVLMIDAQGVPSLGAPIFIKENSTSRDDVRKRIIIKYSDPASVSFNVSEDGSVLSHNHIMLVPEQSYLSEPLLVQDGSYEIYRERDGAWYYEEYLFEQTLEQATPEENSQEPAVKRDLMGRPRKG